MATTVPIPVKTLEMALIVSNLLQTTFPGLLTVLFHVKHGKGSETSCSHFSYSFCCHSYKQTTTPQNVLYSSWSKEGAKIEAHMNQSRLSLQFRLVSAHGLAALCTQRLIHLLSPRPSTSKWLPTRSIDQYVEIAFGRRRWLAP